MLLLISHIAIALLGLISALASWTTPSKNKIYTSLLLVALTLISGTTLAATAHSGLKSVCISGLSYLAIVSVFIWQGSRKLKHQKIKN